MTRRPQRNTGNEEPARKATRFKYPEPILSPMHLFVVPGDTLTKPEDDYDAYFLAETQGLCTHFKYHKHKITFFLASMRQFANTALEGENVHYEELGGENQSYQALLEHYLEDNDVERVTTYTPKDQFFTAVQDACENTETEYEEIPNPNFLTTPQEFKSFLEDNKYFHDAFYRWQRKRLNILVDQDQKPVNGKWSFDADNRERLKDPSKVPSLPEINENDDVNEVKQLVEKQFPDHPGDTSTFWLPTTREESEEWLETFLQERFEDFGPYQDAINSDVDFGFHSVISPMMNNGLLNPSYVVDRAVQWYEEHDTAYNSVEGFIRQIIGWREFMKGVYDNESLEQNYFDNQRGLTQDWYEATTGLDPVDDVIKQSQRYGYAHHIQRLMVVSNAMLLLEIHPKEAYRWFMEFYVDSADWVMQPNVYDMGQYATGGLFATKPYISSSNYIRKMSDYGKASWSNDWDALYWAFIDKHRDTFKDNNRMKFMIRLLDKKGEEELREIRSRAKDVKNRITKPSP